MKSGGNGSHNLVTMYAESMDGYMCDVLNHLCHFMIDIVAFKSNS
jgi:hypothetical protein